ncbi:MAG TPA: 5'-nucleotidase C-terminal domain-containing protein [Thermoanaerobaculia bacterium]|nr:5'-nucleotidase C-terminal domain-containing protein [Thermoanaerobaculia bacterium]
MKRSLAVLLLLFFSFGCATVPQTASAPEPVHVTLVATTDVHGWFAGHVETPKEGGEGVHWGGLPVFASYVQALRAENPGRVLLVDSGDMFQGTLESNLFEGEAVVRGYNQIGYTAAAVGNHEFDFGPVGPDSVPRKPGDDPLGALKRNAALANFPLLSANILDKTTHLPPSWLEPYRLVRVGGVKVGIIGLSTPDTPNVTMSANVQTLDFLDPVPVTIAAAKALRAMGADAVIVIAHIGGRCTDISETHSLASCDRQQEAMRLLEELPPGTIDAFFGGHTHAQMRQFVNGVPTAQALAYSREFSTVDLYIDPRAHHVIAEKSEIRPHTMICSFVYSGTQQCDPRNAKGMKLEPRIFDGKPIMPDAQVASIIDPFLRRVAAKRNEKLNIQVANTATRAYLGESALGNLLADALREAVGADIGMMNSGGIRSDLRAGDLVYSDIFEVSPFDNFPAVAGLSGAQIADVLRLTTTGERGIMQVSGIKYTYDAEKDAAKPSAERDRLVSVTLADGTPLDPQKLYKVVMPDFIMAGGDGTQPVMSVVPAERKQVFNARPIREVLIDVLKKWPQPIAPQLEGRVTVLNPPAAQR